MKAHRSAHRGFTLLELMFAITILGIILGLGAPSFARMARENRVTTLTNDLVTTFAMARSEAARRGTPVAVCPSDDGNACTTDTDYAVGWILFSDDFGGIGEVDGGDEILDVVAALPETYSLQGNQPFIRFFPNGLTTPANDKRFQLQNTENPELVRCVTVSGIGRASTVREECP